MQTEQAPDLTVEIHFASLDTRSEQRALTYFQDFSYQSQTIRLDEASNADAVAHFNFCHGCVLVLNLREGN